MLSGIPAVIVVPSDPSDSVVVVLGSSVNFTCFYLRGGPILSIQWLINQSDFQLPNAVPEFTGRLGAL